MAFVLPLNIPNAPNFAAVNSLMAQAAQTQQQGFKTLQDTLKGTQTAIRDKNTERLMSQLNEAKSLEQFNGAAFQQNLGNLRESLNGEYHTKDFQKSLEARPDQLMARDINQVRLTEATNTQHDNPVISQIIAKRLQDPNADVSDLLGQLKGGQADTLLKLDGLKNTALSRQQVTQSMDLANKEYNLKAQQYKDLQKYRDLQFQELYGTSNSVGTNVGGGASTQQHYKGMDQWDAMIGEAARRHGVPYNLVKAIIEQESGGVNGQRSPVGAMGLMQLMPDTARGLGYDPKSMMDPATNIDAGTKYLANLSKQFGGDWGKVVAGYIAGPGNIQKWVTEGKANNREWTKQMGRLGSDGKLANPNSVKYLQDVAARMQKYAKQGKQDVTQIKQGRLAPESTALYAPVDQNYQNLYAQLTNSGQAGQAFVPYSAQSTASSIMQSLDVQKILNAAEKGKLDIANKSNQEVLNASLNNSPLLAHAGKNGSNLDEWFKAAGGAFKDLDSTDKANIAHVIKNSEFTKNLSPAQQVSLANDLAQIAENSGGSFFGYGKAFTIDELSNMAESKVREFNALRETRDANDMHLIQQNMEQQLMMLQLQQAQEQKEKRQAFLKSVTGL